MNKGFINIIGTGLVLLTLWFNQETSSQVPASETTTVETKAGKKSPRILTLDECIAIALEKSYRIQDVRQNLVRDRANLAAQLARLKSNASLNFSLPQLSQEVTEQFDSESQSFRFFRTNTRKYQANIRINQPLPTNGNISLNSTLYRRDQPTVNPSTDYNTKLYIEFRQPIFTPNTLKMAIRRAELGLESSILRFTSRQLSLIYDVTNAFYMVYRNTWESHIDSLEVMQREKSYKTALERYERGDISEIELLQLEVDLAVARDNLYRSRGQMIRTLAWLKDLIGLDEDEEIAIKTDLEYKPVKIDLEKAIKQALTMGPSTRLHEIWKEYRELDVIDAKRENEFKGTIVASYGLDSAKETIWDALTNFDKSRGITIQFSMPLWDWGRSRYRVRAAEANLRNMELNVEQTKRQIKREVTSIVQRINEAANRLRILKRSQEIAQKGYDMTLEKFNRAEASSQDLTLAQNRLTRAKTAYLNAFIAYKLALASLTRQTMWDFEKDTLLKLS